MAALGAVLLGGTHRSSRPGLVAAPSRSASDQVHHVMAPPGDALSATVVGRNAIALAGALDVAGIKTLSRAWQDVDAEVVTLRLDSLAFIDACGLSAIVELAKAQSQRGRRLAITGTSPRIRRTFALAGLSRLLDCS